MKYLFLLPSPTLGGAERVILNIVKYLGENNRNNIDIYFFSKGTRNDWSPYCFPENVNLNYLNGKSEIYGVLMFFWYFQSKKFDFVFTSHTHINAFVSLCRRFRIIKSSKHISRESTVVFKRFSGLKLLTFRLFYFIYYNIDLIICQSQEMKDSLLSNVQKFNKYNVRKIRNPLHVMHILNSCHSQDVSFPKDKVNILFVGRLVKVKQVDNLIIAFSNVISRGHNAFLNIVGEGPLYGELVNLVDDLNVSEFVNFWGQTSNPYSFMSNADIGILVSEREGFPNVILEMMCSGTKNIIVSPCADELNSLPEVKVLNSSSVMDIEEGLIESITTKSDNSSVYMDYSKEIDISKFCSNVFNNNFTI
ncbi:glycosyltransferase [Vibrio cidicii]|uniref:glycosyltransferase n=2 Tax=Vibrio cidicii TaxID=1763883 RepID=UPI0034E2F768